MKKLFYSLLLLPMLVNAASYQSTMTVTTNLVPVCFLSATNASFGVIPDTRVISYASSKIDILCNKGVNYKITTKEHEPNDYNFYLRGSSGNTDYIAYSINLTPDFTGQYFVGSREEFSIKSQGTGQMITHNLYYRGAAWIGLKPTFESPTKKVKADVYSDTHVITVTY